MSTLSQRNRGRKIHFNKGPHWYSAPWSPDDPSTIGVRLTPEYIHIGWWCKPSDFLDGARPWGLTYTFDRDRWESSTPEQRLWDVEEQTCWCARKAAEKLARIRDSIDRALVALRPIPPSVQAQRDAAIDGAAAGIMRAIQD